MDAVIQFVRSSNKQFTYDTEEGCEDSNLSFISNKRPESKYSNFPDFKLNVSSNQRVASLLSVS